MAPFTICLGLGTTASLFAREPVKLGIQTPRRKLLAGLDFLAAIPPLPFLGEIGYSLGAGLRLSDLGPFAGFRV